jgi:hypothetical protein
MLYIAPALGNGAIFCHHMTVSLPHPDRSMRMHVDQPIFAEMTVWIP